MPSVSGEKRATSAVMAVLAVALLLAFALRRDASTPPSGVLAMTPIAMVTPTLSSPISSASAGSSATTVASPAVTPDALATSVATTLTVAGFVGASPLGPVADDTCLASCIVRLPATDEVRAVLAVGGERASYEHGAWSWAVISRGTADRLRDAGTPAILVEDSRETLRLYVVRLPKEQAWNPLVSHFGDVLDALDGQFLVRVKWAPASVRSLADAGIWVEKLQPAVPVDGRGAIVEGRQSISTLELGALLTQVDPAGIEQTIVDLSGMSSTDDTGIGTRHYTTTGNVMAAEYLFGRLESYGLRVWYEDFITPEGVLATNIVAEIPGRDPGAVYGVMAHFDSIADDRYSAPGADDNATGVASLLEIARILSGYELEHTVAFILVNAEETAILGSGAYAMRAVEERTPLEGIFNLDSIGSSRNGPRLVLNSGPKSAWMMDLLVRINDGYGLGQDIWIRQNPAIVADDSMLREQGFEAVMVARELYGASPVHHTSDDRLEYVSIPYTVSVAELVLLATAALVQ